MCKIETLLYQRQPSWTQLFIAVVVQSYGWEESAVFCRMAWWRPLLLGQVVCRAPIGWQQPRGHPLYCHRRACPSPTLPTPPIWHIAGLSPRACERRVGGISEREGGGYELTRVNGEVGTVERKVPSAGLSLPFRVSWPSQAANQEPPSNITIGKCCKLCIIIFILQQLLL